MMRTVDIVLVIMILFCLTAIISDISKEAKNSISSSPSSLFEELTFVNFLFFSLSPFSHISSSQALNSLLFLLICTWIILTHKYLIRYTG